MYVGAEISQQSILVYSGPKDAIDWKIVRNYAIIGCTAIGPGLFYWYRVLDSMFPSTLLKVAAKKAVTDQLISSTTCLFVFFVGMSILEGKENIFEEFKRKFWPTYKLSCCFWLPAQAINFALLPPYTRVAFVGAASFVWVNILCFIKRKAVALDE